MSGQFEGTKELFNLPADEMIYESVECSAGEGLNFKGRLYISENFLSFSCNMIGMTKKFSIRIQDIKDIREIKKNSLKITTFSDKSQYLGSFGKYRDRVMKLIASLYQGEFGKAESEGEEEKKEAKVALPNPSQPSTEGKDGLSPIPVSTQPNPQSSTSQPTQKPNFKQEALMVVS